MNVELRPEALAQAIVRQAWWVENRPAAPNAFAEEFAQAVEQLGERPASMQIALLNGGVAVRRWLLPKTRCHVYYVIDDGRGVVDVLAVWGARMGRLPPLAKARP